MAIPDDRHPVGIAVEVVVGSVSSGPWCRRSHQVFSQTGQMASYACSLLPFEATRSYGKSSPAHQEVSEMGHALPASVQAKTPFLLYAFVSARRAGCRLLAMRTPRGVAECGNSTCSPNDRHVDSVRRRWGGGGTPTALPAIGPGLCH